MTKEQENLVIENHNLIYYFIHKYNLSIEDYYDICAIGLCKAALNYNTSRNINFDTYAGVVIQNEIKQEFRRITKNDKYVNGIYSLYSIYKNDSGEEFVPLINNITTGLSVYDEILPYKLDNILTEKEYKIVKLCMQGYNQVEISNIMGYSQPQISRLLKSIKIKLQKG